MKVSEVPPNKLQAYIKTLVANGWILFGVGLREAVLRRGESVLRLVENVPKKKK